MSFETLLIDTGYSVATTKMRSYDPLRAVTVFEWDECDPVIKNG